MNPDVGVDFIVRGEGDITFRELVRALARGDSAAGIPGVLFRTPDGFVRGAAERPVAELSSGEIGLPRRDARVLSGYTFMTAIDVVEIALHVRLQLLLDHRDAGPQPPLSRRASSTAFAMRDRGTRAIFTSTTTSR
jgi:hypothetical protein